MDDKEIVVALERLIELYKGAQTSDGLRDEAWDEFYVIRRALVRDWLVEYWEDCNAMRIIDALMPPT